MSSYGFAHAIEQTLRTHREQTEETPFIQLSEEEAVHARAMIAADPEPWFTEIVERHKEEQSE